MWCQLECDYCSDIFAAEINPEDISGLALSAGGNTELSQVEAAQHFNPKTASALCPECGTVMGRLFEHRRDSAHDEAVYQAFVKTCSDSIVRKMEENRG